MKRMGVHIVLVSVHLWQPSTGTGRGLGAMALRRNTGTVFLNFRIKKTFYTGVLNALIEMTIILCNFSTNDMITSTMRELRIARRLSVWYIANYKDAVQ